MRDEVHLTDGAGGERELVGYWVVVRDEAPPLASNTSRLLELFVEFTHTQIVFLDPEFNFIRVNEAYARGTGHPVDFFPGKNHFDIYPSEAKAIFEEVVETKKPFQTFARPFEFPDDPARGVTHWDWTLVPVLDSQGEVELLVFSLTDVTAAERARRELERSRTRLRHADRLESLGRFAGGIAHDFNNVLTVLVSYGALLQDALPSDSPLQADVGAILEAGERGQGLIAQLLAFARRDELQPGSVDVNAALEKMRDLLRRLLPASIALEFALDPEIALARVLASHLDQVVMNLVVNAMQAVAGEGSIELRTRSRTIEERTTVLSGDLAPGPYVVLEVSDDGPGMDAAVLSRVFEPFYSTKDEAGTGLGLATIHAIVSEHGGAIDVRSREGEGALFAVFLPACAPEEYLVPDAVVETPEPRHARILFVDDDPWIVRAMTRHLTHEGYEVVAETNPRVALSALEDPGAHFDLLISDLSMPEMNGVELAIHARKLRPKLSILHISGNPRGAIGWEEISQESTHFLAKPFSPRALEEKVRELLTRSS